MWKASFHSTFQERQQQLAASERALSLSKVQWNKYKEETMSQIEKQMKELQQCYDSGDQNITAQSVMAVGGQQKQPAPNKATSVDRDSGTFSASPSPLKLTAPKKFPPPDNAYSTGTFSSPSSGPHSHSAEGGNLLQEGMEDFENQNSNGQGDSGGFDRSSPSRKAFYNSVPKTPPAENGPPSSEDSRKYTSSDRYYKGGDGYGRYDPQSTRSPGGNRPKSFFTQMALTS